LPSSSLCFSSSVPLLYFISSFFSCTSLFPKKMDSNHSSPLAIFNILLLFP
jgi:hypothetical protein